MLVNNIEVTDLLDLEAKFLTVLASLDNVTKDQLRLRIQGLPLPESQLINEYEKYVKRESDGKEMFLKLMAEIRLTRIANNLPLTWSDNILNAFGKVKDLVVDGQWLTAQVEVNKIVVDGVIVTQPFYNRIKNTIDNYILANY